MRKFYLAALFLLTSSVFSAEITGRVMDAASKKGLAGLRVSNGIEVVLTDDAGKYTLPRRKNTRFVSVVMPADRKAEKHYRVLDKENTDFLLEKRPVRKEFNFIQLGDTENYRFTQPIDNFTAYARTNGSAFIVHTGDICQKSGIAFHAKHLNSKTAGIPVYYGVGNHDLCKGQPYGEKIFEDTFGPVCYAFEEGDWLFIMTAMQGGDMAPQYKRSDVVAFVRNMLKLVPAEKNLVIFNHADYFFSRDGQFGCDRNFVDLSGHNFRALIHGHTHKHYVRKWGKGMIISTGMSNGGGGGNSVAAFRSFKITADGRMTTELKELYVPEIFRISVSPEPEEDGKYLIAVALYRTKDEVKKVTCNLTGKGRTPVELQKVSPWQYTGRICLSGKKETFTVSAEFVSGKNAVKKYWFIPNEVSTAPYVLRRVLSVPGTVYFGTPVLENRILFIAFEDESAAQNGGICAFDITSGKRLWHYRNGNSVRGNLVVTGGAVYGCDSTGTRIKLDAATGKLLEKLPPANSIINYGGVQKAGDHIISGSDVALIVSDNSGKVLWQSSGAKYGGFGTPAKALPDGETLFTAGNWLDACARNIKTGKVIWRSSIKKFIQPAIGFNQDGNIVLATGKYIALLDKNTGKVLAENKKTMCGTFSSPVCSNGRIFIGTQWDGLAALDGKTLKTLWITKRNLGRAWIATVAYRLPSFTVESDPVVAGDSVFAASMNGTGYCLSQEDGKIRWSLPVGVPLIATPVLKDDTIIMADYSGRIFIYKRK